MEKNTGSPKGGLSLDSVADTKPNMVKNQPGAGEVKMGWVKMRDPTGVLKIVGQALY